MACCCLINLTGVAYISSQRLESLANVFVIHRLFWYLRARRKQYVERRYVGNMDSNRFAWRSGFSA